MSQTGSRDKFSLHQQKHYEKVLESPMIYQLTAYENTKPVACAVFARFGNMFTYLYGASDYEYRHLMAPYLLQWQGIKMGKSFGCEWYDFFGVAPRWTSDFRPQTLDGSYDYDLKHQYAGVTRFKLGFGGTLSQAPGTFDAVIDAGKYKLYNFLRKLRRLI
jgi:lipid II:glycine glycyltransferase (peptidoglycan interpeptide bridge formation enzyme)